MSTHFNVFPFEPVHDIHNNYYGILRVFNTSHYCCRDTLGIYFHIISLTILVLTLKVTSKDGRYCVPSAKRRVRAEADAPGSRWRSSRNLHRVCTDIPRSTDPMQGFRDITFAIMANCINFVVHQLHVEFGAEVDVPFQTSNYLGLLQHNIIFMPQLKLAKRWSMIVGKQVFPVDGKVLLFYNAIL